jgi:hypothetical protein
MRCVALFLFLVVSSFPIQAQVRVWEGVLNLPAYEEGAPDPNPSFDQFAISRFSYPYTLRKQITDQRTEHGWRAIYLENEYLVRVAGFGRAYSSFASLNQQAADVLGEPFHQQSQDGYRGVLPSASSLIFPFLTIAPCPRCL